MPRKLLRKLGRIFDLVRLFDLPPWHLNRIIAAQVALYVGLGTIIVATLWNHWKAAHP